MEYKHPDLMPEGFYEELAKWDWKPNRYHVIHQIALACGAIICFWISWLLYSAGDIYQRASRSGRRSYGRFRGVETWTIYHNSIWMYILLLSCFCAAAALLAGIVDHYDRRNNEHIYFKVYSYLTLASFFLMVIGYIGSYYGDPFHTTK